MAQAELKLRVVEFSKAVRGYSCDEVDTYLAYVNDRYTVLAKECLDLRRKMTVLAAGQNEYREEALKEKEKIAAEAVGLVEAGKKEAARLVENARLKAARLLAEAETAAAGILRDAEEKAEAMAASVPAEPVQNPADADFIAAQDNVADRLVAEIETFRQSVFNMYAKHIEELEELGRLTDRFYETKEALSGGVQPAAEDEAEEIVAEEDAAVSAEAEDYPEEEDFYMPAADSVMTEEESTEDEEEDILSSLYTDDEDDELLRIDWASHRAAREQDVTDFQTETEDGPVSFDEDEEAEEADFAFAAEEESEAFASEDDEEDFLSGIASEYLQAGTSAEQADSKPQKPDTLDDLFETEEGRNVGLTGEFDFIYNTKKSADNVAQIRRQPLVDAQKPAKPKKHK